MKIRMKEPKLNYIIITFLIICCGFLGLIYLLYHPEIRNISHYENENYYMCDVVVKDGFIPSNHHYGAIKKEDYELWKSGESGVIQLIDSKNQNKRMKIRCEIIPTIIIYNQGWLPLQF